MVAAKPTLGYRSRGAAVLGLRNAGMTTRQIALRIGITDRNVTALEHSASRARHLKTSEQILRTIVFPQVILTALGPAAAKRNWHVNTLARRIVIAVVDDDLVDAVLDDLVV